MRLFRRRPDEDPKVAALAEARRAAAQARRRNAKVDRHRSRKQEDPARGSTGHEWLGGGF